MERFKGNDANCGLQGNAGDFYKYRQLIGKTIRTLQAVKRTKSLNANRERNTLFYLI